jgi:hypothetical protein
VGRGKINRANATNERGGIVVEQSPLRDLWRRLAETQEHELSCSECFELVSPYVDLEIAGEPAGERLPRLKQHLAQCGVCREEYETLRDLARLDADDRLPSLDELRELF